MKAELHPRNKHRESYNFNLLVESSPELAAFVNKNKYDVESIDFFNPEAVKCLNRALLKTYYKMEYWDIPLGYLCPSVPGRVDYIHHIADLLGEVNKKNIPKGDKVIGLDIGVGANCIYPIVARSEYHWQFLGSDIDQSAIQSANKIIELNPNLRDGLKVRLQSNSRDIFKSIIRAREYYDFTLCNPPFHASEKEAKSSANRKLKNLKAKKKILNFAGQNNELWYKGGELGFLKIMIDQSQEFAKSVLWYTTLVSKESNVEKVHGMLKKIGVSNFKTIPMETGNKKSRIIAWTYHNENEISDWITTRWI